jgi:DNA-binding response OmpR family regulator
MNKAECLPKSIKYRNTLLYMKKRKVLIIDDEEDFGMLMKRFFSQKNYDVYVAYTISDGLKLLDEHLPDIIFLDNNLPDGYGWDKTDYILSTYPQTQLNLISALNVPKTSSSSFRILEKQMLLKELPKMFV